MTVADKYLGLYKEYETLLRENGSDVRTVESEAEQADPAKFARIRMCRLFRNYLTHEHDPGFLEPTDMMFGFLESEVRALKLKDDIVKKHLRYTANYLYDYTVKCTEVLAKACPGRINIIVRKNLDGTLELLSVYDIMMAALEAKTRRIGAVKALRNKPVYCQPFDKLLDLDDSRVHICTSDGTPKGDILGVVRF